MNILKDLINTYNNLQKLTDASITTLAISKSLCNQCKKELKFNTLLDFFKLLKKNNVKINRLIVK